MTTYPDLPWTCINDYLVEIGSIRNKSEFCHRVVSCLVGLVPFDNNGVLGTNEQSGRIFICASVGDASKWVDLHNNYYWKAVPDIVRDSKPMILDWRRLNHTEYGADFISPQGIASGLVTPLLDDAGHFSGALAIHRSKGTCNFNERELTIMQVIQHHLSNYHAIHALLATYDAQLPDADTLASDYKCLTRREAEVAALLCRRFRTGMIATRLVISPMTVYRHVANIFAKLRVFNRDELLERLLSTYPARDPLE